MFFLSQTIDEINPDDISSTLSSDGVLTVTAPLKKLAPPNTERVVPITSVGPTNVDNVQANATL